MASTSRVGSRPGLPRPSPRFAPWPTPCRRERRSSACVDGITSGVRLCAARPRAGRWTTSTSSSIPIRRCRRRSTTARLTTGGPSSPSPTSLAASGLSESLGVMLLADCRPAFGDDAVIRSADLVHELTADPERPWAEYNRGDPITQRQLAKLLGTFGLISVNVRPEVGPPGKGYRRVDFEEAWKRYCPSQIAWRADSDISIRPSVPRPVESAQVSDFADAPRDGSKNGNLSNNHAGWDAGTLNEPQNGERNRSATSDPGDIPECLRRYPCDHCGGAVGITRNYDWPGLPGGVWLHSQCEAPWFDSQSRAAGRAS